MCLPDLTLNNKPVSQGNNPIWMPKAISYLGEKEIPGYQHNPMVLRGWEAIGATWFTDDETPWCGSFVGLVFKEVGLDSEHTWKMARARHWLNWGVPISRPAYGCVVVFTRGSGGHVAFVTEVLDNGNLMVLGGNQGNQVSIAEYDKDRVLGYRWPKDYPFPTEFL